MDHIPSYQIFLNLHFPLLDPSFLFICLERPTSTPPSGAPQSLAISLPTLGSPWCPPLQSSAAILLDVTNLTVMPLLQKASLVTPQSAGSRGNSFIRLSSHFKLTLFMVPVLSPAPLPPPPQCNRNVCNGSLHIDTTPFLEAVTDGAESQLFGTGEEGLG